MIVRIKGYNSYFVGDDGVVYSNKSGSLKPLRPLTVGHDGYEKVRLYNNGVWRDCFVHRLVAEAFIQNPENLPLVNHKDENPSNNRADNLEWCTVAYNNVYGNALKKKSATMKLRFEQHPSERVRMSEQSKNKVWSKASREKVANSLSRPVSAVRDGVIVATFKSAKEAEEMTGIKRSNICKVLKGERTVAGGVQWMYSTCCDGIENGGTK